MNTQSRPRIFIGSSSEALSVADAVFSELERQADAVVWNMNIFKPTRGTLEQLDKFRGQFDFAVLILSPDDQRISRGKRANVARDNVIAELGLFIGLVGRLNVFMLKPADAEISLPTDFLGIGMLEYRSDVSNRPASVRTACNIIKQEINERSTIPSDGGAKDVEFWHVIADRQLYRKDVRGLIECSSRLILISGVTLNHIIASCKEDLRAALARGATIGVIVAKPSKILIEIYSKYTVNIDKKLPLVAAAWTDFFDALPLKDRKKISYIYSNLFLARSIGLYDDRVYVSEFCIGTSASACPSYSPARGSHTYNIAIKELATLVGGGTEILGTARNSILKMIPMVAASSGR